MYIFNNNILFLYLSTERAELELAISIGSKCFFKKFLLPFSFVKSPVEWLIDRVTFRAIYVGVFIIDCDHTRATSKYKFRNIYQAENELAEMRADSEVYFGYSRVSKREFELIKAS